ncbi:hypothetical protein ABL78_5049 [Leptomonas seymouri]|uniref:C2HC/C3H-type domain-containing protein n=1 Tax=Leptomonas seymouri TaxID=5684 RepID=A0A0N1IJN9_LEPSE|nr:hypothetical protein ABL78_5049 [Leptomonas seymouri]|eukprot:KPI85868.1 hypothetical protein ABL78_5049 [Leptomonas seymouri]
MSTARRSGSGPGGLTSSVLSSGRKSGSNGTTPSSTTKRASGSSSKEGSGLIITRGLQEILDTQRKFHSAEEPSSTGKGLKDSRSRRRSSGQAPNFVICYLCGRQFGSTSIAIHRPQCFLKKMIEWERGDPAIRGPKPMSPEEHEEMVTARVASAAAAGTKAGRHGASKQSSGASGRRVNNIELYNRIQMSVFNEASLAPCPNCGRTFLPDRLQVHLHSCKPGNTSRPVRRPPASTINNTASAAAVSTTNGSATSASPTATKPAGRPERPTRASGAHAVSTGTDVDDESPRSCSGEDVAIRARGSYAVPPVDGVECVPPQEPSAMKPSQRRCMSNSSKNISVQCDVGGDAAEEAEPRDAVIDMDAEEVKPPSPRVDTERRLSSAAILRGDPEMSGSSAPNRPASMEPSTVPMSTSLMEEEFGNSFTSGSVNVVYSLPQSRGAEHVAGSRPRKLGSASVPCAAPVPELVSEPREVEVVEILSGDDELRSAPVVGAHGYVCTVPGCNPALGDSVRSSSSAEKRSWTPKKIPLNNVSHFKNVESRLKLQQQAERSVLVPCQYCGRTFVPERLQKHEGCCVERNKPPQRRSVALKARPSSAPAPAARQAKPAPSAPPSAANPIPTAAVSAAPSKASPHPAPSAETNGATASAPTPPLVSGKAKFCGGCGARVTSESQNFCTECGFKL